MVDLPRLLVVCLASVCLARAYYFLDDKHPAIQYLNWGDEGYIETFDYSKIYGYTLKFSEGLDGNYMMIPFAGSGITLYGIRAQYTYNFTVSVDGNTSTNHLIDSVPGCCSTTIQPIYNFTIYDSQSLPYSNHSLTLRVSMALNSVTYFDYAMVNETNLYATLNGTSSYPGSSAHPSPQPDSHVAIAPIFGGTMGGGTLLLFAILVLFYLRRRSRREDPAVIDSEVKSPVSGSNLTHAVGPMLQYEDVPTQRGLADASLPFPVNQPNPITLLQPQTDHMAHLSPMPPEIPTLSPLNPTDSPMSRTMPSTPQPISAAPRITTEEAAFLHNLYSLNVPADEIATLMEVMRAKRQTSTANGVEGSSGVAGHAESGSLPPSAPPGYDLEEQGGF